MSMPEYDEQGGQVVPMRPTGGGGLSLGTIAPQDRTTSRAVVLTDPDTGKRLGALNVEYRVNRFRSKPTELSEEDLRLLDDPDDDEAVSSLKNSKWVCEIVAGWDLLGDSSVPGFVGSDEVVPLTPEMVEFVPLWIRRQIIEGLSEIVNPNLKKSRTGRRR